MTRRPAAHCALAAIIVAALGLDGDAADTAIPFDHGRHQGGLATANRPAIDCAGCHTLDKRSRPRRIGHGACFGECHGDPPAPRSARDRARKVPYTIEPSRRALCSVCHSPDALDRVEKGANETLGPAPPRRPDRVVSAPVPHAAHARVDGDCSACHTAIGGTKSKPSHERCLSCHGAAAEPAMSDCATCHSGSTSALARPYSTRALFDHGKHAPRIAKDAERCRSCHSPESIRPSKSACSGCHDGKAAFSVVEAACRRCHSPPATPVPRPRARRARFSHADHEGLDKKLSCADCHQLDDAGEPRRPGNDHAPCADSGCHERDFLRAVPGDSDETSVCGACHIGSEPWLELYSSVTPPADTEFGSLYSHRAHSGGDEPRHSRACTVCHKKSTSARELRLPRSHAACSGRGCHEPGPGEHALDACGSCHIGNLVVERRQRQSDKRWSVREKFTHDKHRTRPESADRAVPCTDCHAGIDDAGSIFEIPAPAKATCASCHDGRSAFKLTGHGCSRCHHS